MDVVQVSELCKKYKNRYRTKIALDNISFSVKKRRDIRHNWAIGCWENNAFKDINGTTIA